MGMSRLPAILKSSKTENRAVSEFTPRIIANKRANKRPNEPHPNLDLRETADAYAEVPHYCVALGVPPAQVQ